MFSSGRKSFEKLLYSSFSDFLQIKEYCDASSGHGLRYITEEGRHWIERALWIFLVILGSVQDEREDLRNKLIFVCIYRVAITLIFIWPILRKYFDSPTITTIGTTNYPIWKVGIETSF